MVFFPRKRRPARKRAARRPVARARGGRKSSAIVSGAVAKYVKREIHRNIENKCVQVNGGSSFGNVLESPDMNAYPMCPLTGFWTIGQGVGQGSRVGNTIKTRKVYLNYVIRPTAYDFNFNTVPQPMDIQLYLGYVKNTPCFSPVPGDINFLYQAGSSTAAPIGTIRDIISVINTDYWVIKKKWTHKVGHAAYTGTSGNTVTTQQSQFYANNDYKYNAIMRMDITKHIPKTHVFNDASNTTNTRNLFFMYEAVAASGVQLSSTQLPCNIEFWIDFHYEDA